VTDNGVNRGQDFEGEEPAQAAAPPPAMGEGCEIPLSFDIGADVVCEDGRCGKLARVVIDPVTEQVTDLIVARGLLQRETRVVPVSTVKSAVPGQVELSIPGSALKAYRAFKEVAYRAPSADWHAGRYRSEDVRYSMLAYEGLGRRSVMPSRQHHLQEGISLDQRTIGQGTQVRDAEGNAGEVDHVLVDCLRSDITHIVVRHGLLGDAVIVPVAMISRVEDKVIHLAANRAAVEALPRYKPEK
jgi:sporulation protein YlmC with PRC-barrel domain